MSALVIGQEEMESMAKLKKFAELPENIFSREDMEEMIKQNQAIGDKPGFAIFIPMGYRVVYSITKQKDRMYRQISISIAKEGKLPHMVVVEEIMHHFGFEGYVADQDDVWIEEDRAVNLRTQIKE